METERYQKFLENGRNNINKYVKGISKNEQLYNDYEQGKRSIEDWYKNSFNGSTGL